MTQLCGLGGFTPGFLSHIENGNREPGLTAILRIASALNVDPSELVRDLPAGDLTR
ncbi:helix-turn-helix domain-containing protein [Aeromicrobium marinum]|uniref:helix-turn-helix domain-containing protein n=1 Tax=Aeromicrobium marinum TaxID=219314 RepID=UPI003CCB1770